MDILNHERGLDALSFALMVAPEIAEDQYNDARQDPYINEMAYLHVAAVLYEMEKRMEKYRFLPFPPDKGPTLRGFLYYLLEQDL